VDKEKAYAKAQHDAFENFVRKQDQDKLDSDARIASNVPSAADRKLLEQRNTRRRAEYARAVRERTERLEFEEMDYYYCHGGTADLDNYDETFAASDSFIREQEAHNARATRMLQAREANGEDVRTVRASWEAFDRYGCFGALDDAFFDPRNG
jgi:aryl-alcohol dehydrogenase-like predicted oxidoreductase